MTEELEELIEDLKKDKTSFFALSDFNVLGEDIFIIKSIGDQLTLYTNIIGSCNCNCDTNKKDVHIQISSDTLWGIGQMIWNLTKQLEKKMKMIDDNFDMVVRKGLPEKEGE